MSHTALKLAAALLIILGLAGAALVASRLIQPQQLEFGPPLNRPADLGRIDALHGWAWDIEIPDDLSAPDVGRLMLTDDGGFNWRASTLPRWEIFDGEQIPQVQFVDASHGWLLPYPDSVPPYPPDRPDAFAAINKLWRTSDGGRTWQSTDLPAVASSYGVMSFVSKDSGFVLASPLNMVTPTWILYRTDDGGATWSRVANLPLPADRQPATTVEIAPSMLVFSDMSNGLLVVGQEGPTVLQTHDGGVTWTPVELPQTQDPEAVLLGVTKLRVSGSSVVMAAVVSSDPDLGDVYPFFTSADAGRTWQVKYPVTHLREAYPPAIETLGAGDAPTLGTGPVSFSQQYAEWSIVDSRTWVYVYGNNVATTRDAGETWSKVTGSGLPEGAMPFRPAFISPDEGWVLLGWPLAATFGTTHDGGRTWQISRPKTTPLPTS